MTKLTPSGLPPFANATPVVPVFKSVLDDDIDYRAMMAREVFKEREWRMGGIAVTPAECALRDLEPANLRMTIEQINGEPL